MKIQEFSVVLKDKTPAKIHSAAQIHGPQVLEFWKTVSRQTDFLLRQPEEYTHTADREGRYLEKLEASAQDLVLLCRVDNKLAGYCQLSQKRYAKTHHRGVITLAVEEAYWGRGIGSCLMQLQLEYAKGLGISQLELEVMEGNQRALRLYQALGFVEASRRPDAFLLPDGRYASELLLIKKL